MNSSLLICCDYTFLHNCFKCVCILGFSKVTLNLEIFIYLFILSFCDSTRMFFQSTFLTVIVHNQWQKMKKTFLSEIFSTFFSQVPQFCRRKFFLSLFRYVSPDCRKIAIEIWLYTIFLSFNFVYKINHL